MLCEMGGDVRRYRVIFTKLVMAELWVLLIKDYSECYSVYISWYYVLIFCWGRSDGNQWEDHKAVPLTEL